MRRVLSAVAAIILCAVSLRADVKLPRGFDGKVYQASMALYGTLPKGATVDFSDGETITMSEDSTHFLCTVTAIEKVKGGYILVGAGHCTAEANPEDLPKGLIYSVSDNIGTEKTQVQLLKSELVQDDDKDYVDYSVWLMKTDKKISVIEMGDESSVAVGDETVDVNFSLGEKLTKQLSKGYISSTIAGKDSKMRSMMLVTQFGSHGASGSAIVSEKTHKIIGLVIGGIDGAIAPTIAEPISRIRYQVRMAALAVPRV